jgi:hypothetical protein
MAFVREFLPRMPKEKDEGTFTEAKAGRSFQQKPIWVVKDFLGGLLIANE